MTRPVPLLAAAGLLLAPLFLPPSLAPAAFAQDDAADPALVEDAVDLIPAEAGVVVRVADPDSAFTHIEDFVGNAAPQYAGFVRQGRALLGVAIQNPTLSGINLKEPWYVVMLPNADAKPDTVFLLPVANAQAAEESIGPNFTSKVLGTYLAYGASADAVGMFGGATNVSKSLPPGTTDLAGASDVTVFVNLPRLRTVYGDSITDGLDQLQERMEEQAGSPEAAAGQKQFLALLKHLVNESTGFTMGLSADADKLTMTQLLNVKPGSDTAAVLATQKPAKFDVLNKLPEGLDGYLAGEGDFAPLADGLAQISAASIGGADAAKDLMTTLAKAGMTGSAGGFKLGGGGEPLLSGVQVTKAKDVAKFKTATQDYFTKADGVEQNGVKTNIKKTGTVDVGGVEMTVYTTSMEAVGSNPEAQQGVQVFDMMFGGALEQKVGYTSNAMIQILSGDEAFAKEVVAHYNGNSGHTNEPLEAARKLVPTSGNLFGAIDLAKTIQAGLAAAIESGQVPIPLDAAVVRGVDVPSTYAAFVTTVDGATLKTEAVLPAEQVRSIVDLGTAIQNSMGGGAQGF